MHNTIEESLQCHVVTFRKEDSLQPCGFPPILQKNRIHIWSAGYRDLDRHFGILSGFISQAERQTAASFRKSIDARKYILRHGVMRSILGNYTHLDPERVSLINGKNGKPELDLQECNADVSFNLSHTSEMILIGVTRKHRIGVDIVKMDPSYRFQDSADYILTPAEKSFMLRVEPALRYKVFFRIWALKEAMLKATGGSLTMMKHTDISACIQDVFSSSDREMRCQYTHPPFLIWQFNSGPEHHCVIAAEAGNPF